MDLSNVKHVKSSTRLINFIVDTATITIFSEIINLCLIKSHNEKSITLNMDLSIKTLSFFFYYFFMEAACGQTVGKMITRTKVVSLDRTEPKTSLVIIRTLIRIIPVLNLFDALSFLKTNKAGLHDSLTSTQLVSIKDLPLG